MAFIQGQGASNSSSSSSASTSGATSQQQESDAHKSSNINMDSSESTPNLTHATRVSPATVSGDDVPHRNKIMFVWWCGWKFSIFHFLVPFSLCEIFFPLTRKNVSVHYQILRNNSLGVTVTKNFPHKIF